MGRPTIYTEEIIAEICERMSLGEPLALMCRDEHMPGVRTVYDWMAEDSERGRTVSARLARARDDGLSALAAECLAISDDGSNDYRMVKDKDGKEREVFDAEHVQRSKLRIETRLKLLAVWDPKKYGAATMVKHADADGKKLPPPPRNVNIVVVQSPNRIAGPALRNVTPSTEDDDDG